MYTFELRSQSRHVSHHNKHTRSVEMSTSSDQSRSPSPQLLAKSALFMSDLQKMPRQKFNSQDTNSGHSLNRLTSHNCRCTHTPENGVCDPVFDSRVNPGELGIPGGIGFRALQKSCTAYIQRNKNI